MPNPHRILLLILIFASALSLSGQSAPAASPSPEGQAPALANRGTEAAPPPSALLEPALTDLSKTVDQLKIEKWKGGTVRAEASANIASIQKDLQGALAVLISDADAAPEALGKLLPLSRNVDALYDVLLRVVDGARVAAPAEQVAQLQLTMANLEKARQMLNTRMEDTAAAREKQISDLQVALKTQPAPICPVVAPPSPPATSAARKKAPVKKKPKPSAPAQPSATQPATPATKPS